MYTHTDTDTHDMHAHIYVHTHIYICLHTYNAHTNIHPHMKHACTYMYIQGIHKHAHIHQSQYFSGGSLILAGFTVRGNAKGRVVDVTGKKK